MLNRLARAKRAKTQLQWATCAVLTMLCMSGCHWVGGAVVTVKNVGASPLHQVNHSSFCTLFDAVVNVSISSCVL